jgi:hypothetical protein
LRKQLYGKRELILAPVLPGNHFSYREKEGMISFMPRGRVQEFNFGDQWKRDGRQSIKPARWMKSMLRPRLARMINDSAFAQFNTILRHEELRQKLTFKLVPVEEGYDSENFAEGAIESCMWDDPVAPFYHAFKCKTVVAVGSDGVFRGRALIWPEVEPCGELFPRFTLMDRIYSDCQEVELALEEHAESEGWWRKEGQNSNPGPFIRPDGSISQARLTVRTNRDLDEIDYYPYLDTFAYGGEDWVSTDPEDHSYYYRNTDGSRDRVGGENQVQDVDGNWIDRDEAVLIEGRWYHQDSDDVVICKRTQNYILFSDALFVDLGDDSYYIHRQYVREAA